MTKKSSTPAIRFKGFTDTWEQRKLGDIVERVVRKNTNNESSLPLTISAQYGLVDQITYFNNRVASRDVSNYYLVLNGEFAYNKSTSDGFPFGAVKRLDLYEKGVLSTLYIVFSIKNQSEIDSDYLTVFFDTDRWHKGVSERAAEGARNHGLLNISADDFFDIDIFLPRHKEEQVAIGSYLRHLDNLITLHQRKYDKLTNVKKSMLEKMFPKNGSNVPEIRFKGFTEAWEQRKLGDVAKYRNGKAHENDISEQGKFIVVNSKFVSTNGEVRKFSNKQIEPLFKNEIAFVLSDVPNGRAIARTFLVDKNDKYTLNQRIAGITPVEGTCPYFLHILMNRNKYFLQFDDGAKQTNLSVDDVIEFAEYYPSSEEQQQIGNFFRQLDNLITLHQRELEKLKNLKKACLEKMFV